MSTLYHYTTKKGADGIRDSGIIHMSGNAHYGRGTYLTDMSPYIHTQDEIAHRNWRGGAWSAVRNGKTDWVVTIRINPHAVELVDLNRGIWLYPENDLDLNNKRVVYGWNVDSYKQDN